MSIENLIVNLGFGREAGTEIEKYLSEFVDKRVSEILAERVEAEAKAALARENPAKLNALGEVSDDYADAEITKKLRSRGWVEHRELFAMLKNKTKVAPLKESIARLAERGTIQMDPRNINGRAVVYYRLRPGAGTCGQLFH